MDVAFFAIVIVIFHKGTVYGGGNDNRVVSPAKF